MFAIVKLILMYECSQYNLEYWLRTYEWDWNQNVCLHSKQLTIDSETRTAQCHVHSIIAILG